MLDTLKSQKEKGTKNGRNWQKIDVKKTKLRSYNIHWSEKLSSMDCIIQELYSVKPQKGQMLN